MKMRVLAFLLALLFVLPMIAACSNSSNPTETTEETKNGNTPGGQTGDETETEDEKEKWYFPDLPSDDRYKDKEFVFLAFTGDTSFYWHDSDFLAEMMDGDTMNDAVYQRNTYVQEQLKIDLVLEPGDANLEITRLQTSIQAGEDDYQAADVTTLRMFSMATNGLLTELNSMGTIDLEAPWWDQHSLSDLSILHQNYGLYGDIGNMFKRTLGIVLFNKRLFNDQFPTIDLYEVQDNKEWTLDYMMNLVYDLASDLDGDTQMTEDDQFGMVYQGDMMPIALICCDIPFVTKDENDVPALTLNCEKTFDAIDILADLMYDTEVARSSSANQPKVADHHDTFKTQHSVFDVTEIHAAIDFRSMATDFGILCMPLFDEFQTNYLTCINPHVSATLVVPFSITEPEFVGYVLDCLSAAGKDYMTPAFYDITLQGRSTRDEQSRATIDLVSASVRYDLGYLADWGMSEMIRGLADNRSKDFSSRWGTNSKSFEEKMNQTIEEFEFLS